MTDPFFDSLASALAGQAATALSKAGALAVQKIRDILRKRSEQDPETQTALDAAEQPSASDAEVAALAQRLREIATASPELADQLRAEGARVHDEISAHSGGVVNINSGNVSGNVIQARDINGPITLN